MIILFSALVALVVGLVIGWAFGREWEAIDCQPLHAAAQAVVTSAGVVTTVELVDGRRVHQTVDPEALGRLREATTGR